MRAHCIQTPGESAWPELRHLPMPEAGPGEVLVEVRKAAINWADTQIRRGVYPNMPMAPLVGGLDCAGVVAAVGAAVEGLAEGDRVAAISPTNTGAFAEYGLFPADHVMPLRQEVSFAQGAAMLTAGLTSYHLLFSVYALQLGDWVLIHAISGGVGLIAAQLAADAGARVIGTTYSPHKVQMAKEHGAQHVIDRNLQDYAEAVMEVTDGKGVNLVINSLGGQTLWRDFDLLDYYGQVVNIGEAEDWPSGDLRELRDKMYRRTSSFTCFELLHAMPGSPRWNRGVEHVTGRLADGRLRVPVAQEFPFAQCADMYRALESRKTQGKLLLDVGEPLTAG